MQSQPGRCSHQVGQRTNESTRVVVVSGRVQTACSVQDGDAVCPEEPGLEPKRKLVWVWFRWVHEWPLWYDQLIVLNVCICFSLVLFEFVVGGRNCNLYKSFFYSWNCPLDCIYICTVRLVFRLKWNWNERDQKVEWQFVCTPVAYNFKIQITVCKIQSICVFLLYVQFNSSNSSLALLECVFQAS